MRVLVVDDEERMRRLIRIYLENAGFEVSEAVDGQMAVDMLGTVLPHAVILDVMLPRMDGWDTARHLRQQDPELPILMLTARSSIEDKVTGLSLVDDYLTKPFDGRELIARIQSIVRRAHIDANDEITFAGIRFVVHLSQRRVTANDQSVDLTQKEFDVLALLARHPGRTFSREEIVERLWGYDYEGEARTVDSHVKNLREKLREAGIENTPLKTVWGIGYKFEAE